MGGLTGARASRWHDLRGPGGWTALDALLALVVTVVVQAEVWLGDLRPRPALAGVTLLTTLPLAWRRSAPAMAATICCTASLLANLATTSRWSPQLTLLPLVIAVYSAAARTSGRRALVTGAATFALLWAGHAVTADGDVSDFFPWLLWAGAWGSGSVVQRRTLAADVQSRRAAVLEVERDEALHEVSERERAAAERERDRIARELHDVVAHAVSIMVVQAGAERLRLGSSSGRTGSVLADIEDTGRDALRELRTMLEVLHDRDKHRRDPGAVARVPDRSMPAPVPSVDLLPHLFARTRAAGLPLTVTGQDQLDGVPVGVGLATYRIVQESLTNVVRHAGMAPTTVSFSRTDAMLHLEVLNQPVERSRGTTQWAAVGQHPQNSNGVVGMRERARSHGGQLSAGPTSEGGYMVRAYLPCPAFSARADQSDDEPASAGT